MSKHIVNILPAFVPGDGIGNAARVRVAGLLKLGYRVSVICATAKVGAKEFQGLNLMQAGAGWEADRSSLTDEMFSTTHSADLVFVEFGCFNVCHELLQNLAVPMILFYQGLTPATLMQSDMYGACYWRAVGELRKLPQPALILAASQFTLDEYSKIAGSFTGLSKVVPLFGNSEINAQVSENGSSREPLKILAVGQLFPHKNYEVLIDATRLLNADGVKVEVKHVGGANDLVAFAYRERLLKAAKPLGDKFRFLGRVEQSVLDQSYRDAHVVVIPSLHEGYSLPAREALLHGKPVVASYFGALPETLQGAAEHFHPLDAHELAQKLKHVSLWSEVEWERACKRARDAAPSHSQERYVQDCVDAIESTLEAHAIRPDMRLDEFANGASHVPISESDNLISGTIRLAGLKLDTRSTALEACVTSSLHVLRVKACTKIAWQQRTASLECHYQLSLEGIEDWTSVYLRFIDVHSRERVLEIQGVRRDRLAVPVATSEHSELRRLASSIAENYRPKGIVSSDNRILTIIKTRVANTILRLIYQVFIGPQMATMQSQLRLFSQEISSLRAEIQGRNALKDSCSPAKETSEISRLS